MKTLPLILLWALFAGAVSASPPADAGSASAAPGTPDATEQRVAAFSLADQFEQVHHFRFPRPKPILLTVADRKGAAQVETWVRPVKERFGEVVEQVGIADVSKTPAFLQERVRRGFRKQYVRPVLLDWQGTQSRTLGCERGEVNVLMLDREGRVRFRATGGATASGLEQLHAEIRRILERAPAPAPAQPVSPH